MSYRFNKYLLGALLLLLCQCTRNRDSITAPEAQRETGRSQEYVVYSVVLNSFAAAPQALEFVMTDSTVFWNFEKDREYIKSHFPDIADETLDNYLAINEHNIALLNIPDLRGRCHIINSSKSTQWKALFPKAKCLIHVSQVGFNTFRDQAIVYVSEYVALLVASGHLYFLHKELSGWYVSKSVLLWIS
jgi:hypothetical protein